MVQFVLNFIGTNGGVVAGAWNHVCDGCTHDKCYATPEYLTLVREHQHNLGIELPLVSNFLFQVLVNMQSLG